jgi:AcrR family transcriptional regulator
MTAPYRRIADEIRARIGSGELRPGDAVPSARRISRDWGVALATATKVLATLHAAGLTRSMPGVGTVVSGATADRPAAPRPAAAPGAPAGPPPRADVGLRDVDLSRDRIVRAAIGIADAEGPAQLTMRRIATELGVATMSLYRHVGGKDDLLIQMMDTVLGEEPLPDAPPDGWRARLELSSRLQWKGFRRHPWLAPALSITRPQLVPNGMRHTEWALRALDGLGLAPQQKIRIHVALFSHVRGLALSLEPEAQAEQDSGMTSDEWMETRQEEFFAVMRGGDFPMMLELFSDDLDMDLDELFEFGLGRFLDGLEHYLSRESDRSGGFEDQRPAELRPKI